jgi:hypothetical protein
LLALKKRALKEQCLLQWQCLLGRLLLALQGQCLLLWQCLLALKKLLGIVLSARRRRLDGE